MEALQQMAAPTATVIRDGEEAQLPARDLVPGDVILLKAGDKVPADCRLIEIAQPASRRSRAHGRIGPGRKANRTAWPATNLAAGDRTNIGFAGTAVTYGRGRAVVVATGMNTEFGKIAQMLQDVEQSRTPLQENLDRVGRVLAVVALVIVDRHRGPRLVADGGRRLSRRVTELLLFGIALAVAVVPEALPAVVTVSLAIGVQRMVKRNALVRRLPAVETLGSTSVICSDKTGTLTKDEMTVQQIYVAGRTFEVSGAGYEPQGEFSAEGKRIDPPEPLAELLRAGVLSSDAHLVHDETEGRWDIQGDPTEGALVAAAAKAGLHKPQLDEELPRVDEIPFSSETKRMTTLHQADGRPGGLCQGRAGSAAASLHHAADRTGRNRIWTSNSSRTLIDAGRRMAENALARPGPRQAAAGLARLRRTSG